MTIKEILRNTTLNYNLSPLDAEILLSYVLKKPKEYLLTHPEKKLSTAQLKNYNLFCKRRVRGEPIAYILKQKEFYGINFFIDKNVLVPRPETEILAEVALHEIRNKDLGIKNVIDIGTGSGNIITAITKNIPTEKRRGINFYASDISESALRVARRNIKKYKFDKIIDLKRSDLLDFLFQDKFSLIGDIMITANLPYLDQKWRNLLESSESKGLKFEPKIALEGGFDGLGLYRRLAGQIKRIKGQTEGINIVILCEIGDLQKVEMKNIFSFAKKIKFHKDLAGKNRLAEISL
jgi:release factor glutamine methyltransferase